MKTRILVIVAVVLAVLGAAIFYWTRACDTACSSSDVKGRGEGLVTALAPYGDQKDATGVAAATLISNYEEDRANAVRWSGIYWWCVFAAAGFSAIAGVILKLESIIPNDKVKKDVAALLAVTAAILVTLSSSGRFSDKWQANRLAAAQLERLGYEFLADSARDPAKYYHEMRDIQYARQLTIIGPAQGSGAGTPVADGGKDDQEQK